jgi:hypothetical protein
MKKLLPILAISLLSGCSWLQFQAPFDTAEYSVLTQIYTDAETFSQDCADTDKTKQNFTKMRIDARYLVNYSTDLPANDLTLGMVKNLQTIVEGAYQMYQSPGQHSKAYCELKLNAIKTAAETVKKAAAQRRR